MARGRKTGGRQKGTPNKLTVDTRAMILSALDQAGGEQYLVRQAEENPGAFLALVSKTLPRDIKAEIGPNFASLLRAAMDRRLGVVNAGR
jgi:hypothetical protein